MSSSQSAWGSHDIYLFHGTDGDSAAEIRQRGIDFSKCRPRRDFGLGFYTTTSRSQAEDWATKTAVSRRREPIVLTYKVKREELARLATLCFVRPDSDDLWNFVAYCRSGGQEHGRPGWYDVVIGPVTLNSVFPRTCLRNSDQVSFHSDQAVACLALVD
jgi:hypothetical protein